MKYVVKGGIWKNTEDEILKSAVMKYGLNQWSRISSLLVRKSAKECKARWYEWLDPSIKKTEWNREEEEKLLHLSKIFPTQWRTIAPLIGRTPAQCIEKYENLLDRAMGREETDPNDPRRLRAGEIDPNPETKACRPDPIDMDEDEREMLQECRARLANTKGKKAKRKAREKQLEEARRLAQLQKQRELKQAGIDVYRPIKIRGIDYNAEIPFQALVPEGRHSVQATETPKVDSSISNDLLKRMEQKLVEEEERKKKLLDKKRLQKIRQKNLPLVLEQQNQANKQLLQFTDIELPQPMISDQELLNISKMTGKSALSLQDNPTSLLVADVSTQRRVITSTVRQTPLVSAKIMQDAADLAMLRDAQTPLVSSTPAMISQQTPQISQLRPFAIPEPSNKRQKLDRDFIVSNEWEHSKPQDIRTLLASLPKPQQHHQVTEAHLQALEHAIMSAQQEINLKRQEDAEMLDEEDRLNQIKQEKEKAEAVERQLMSTVLKQGLPRPIRFVMHKAESQAEQLIFQKMKILVDDDNYRYPMKGGHKAAKPTEPLQPVTVEQISWAKAMIEREISGERSYDFGQQMSSQNYDTKSESKKIEKLERNKIENESKWKSEVEKILREIDEAVQIKQKLMIEKEIFTVLQDQELRSLDKRSRKLSERLQDALARELELQEIYRLLK